MRNGNSRFPEGGCTCKLGGCTGSGSLIERLETWKRNGSQLGNATWPLLVLLALLGLFGLEGIQEVLLSHDGREIEYIECMIAVSESLPCELRAMPEAPFIQHDGSPSSCSTPTT